jgi:hypothetical protein
MMKKPILNKRLFNQVVEKLSKEASATKKPPILKTVFINKMTSIRVIVLVFFISWMLISPISVKIKLAKLNALR